MDVTGYRTILYKEQQQSNIMYNAALSIPVANQGGCSSCVGKCFKRSPTAEHLKMKGAELIRIIGNALLQYKEMLNILQG